MSVDARTVPELSVDRIASMRGLALAGAGITTLVYLSVLGHVVDVVGGIAGVSVFALEVLASLALAVVLARTIPVRRALAVGAGLLIAGLVVYFATVPRAYLDPVKPLTDTVTLLTGLSVLRMTKAGVWALGFTPGPLFVSWYFFLRREYTPGVIVGGAALALFVLTGDLDTVTALIGVLGAVAAVGFGRLDHEGGGTSQRNAVVALIVVMLVVTTSVSLVPGGEARPLLPDPGGTTVEGNLLSSDSEVGVLGSIDLSAKVRFTVTANESSRWRVGAFDRYTGQGWVRTGQSKPYTGALDRPPGSNQTRIRQEYTAESAVAVMPAAWKPVGVEDRTDRTRVTSMAGLQPTETIAKGDRYTVVSYRNDPSAETLREAGTDYPEAIRERYLQVPESTPNKVGIRAGVITDEAETAYDKAVAIERWLERNKEYSLNVRRPDGDVASSFIFDMRQGYCVYYATAMVTMLRTQGIPARFVVGYTPGEQALDDTWIVRGYNSHAWVEVYFPDEGWVAFDPTPAGPRQAAENARLDQARASNEANIDTNLSGEPSDGADGAGDGTAGGGGGGTDGTGTAELTQQINQSAGGEADNPIEGIFETPTPEPSGFGGFGGLGGRLPSRQTVLYGLVLLAGGVTALQRTGVIQRGYRELWLRQSPEGPPEHRVRETFARLEYLLGRKHRPRHRDETPREYLEAIGQRTSLGAIGRQVGPERDSHDERVARLFDLYERARYAGRVSPEEAETAEQLLRDLLKDRSWGGWGR